MRGFMPDCGGAITRLAVSVVPQCFADHMAGRALLHALERFIPTLPPELTLVVLARRESRRELDRWLSRVASCCRIEHIDADFAHGEDTMALWTQDSFFVADGGETYLHPTSENSTPHGLWLGRAMGKIVRAETFALAGGNMLVGPDFKLIGCESLPDEPRRRSAMLAALERVDDRPVFEVGYRLGQGIPSGPGAEFYRMRQYGGHIDRSVAVTGLRRAAKPLLLVSRGLIAPRADPAGFGPIGDRLDRTAEMLSASGFAVLRNDIPFVPVLGKLQLRPRLYNNVLVENEVRPGRARPLVWVPQFAEEEPALEEFDAANLGIWQGLGFEPIPCHGWSKLSVAMGGLRCATKVLGRR
jgi:hypothetical protein